MNQNAAFFMLTDAISRKPVLVNLATIATIEHQGTGTTILFDSGATRHVVETGDKVIQALVQDTRLRTEYITAWQEASRKAA